MAGIECGGSTIITSARFGIEKNRLCDCLQIATNSIPVIREDVGDALYVRRAGIALHEMANELGTNEGPNVQMVSDGCESLVEILRGSCLLYTSDAADERSSVDLGGRRIIKKKKKHRRHTKQHRQDNTSQ